MDHARDRGPAAFALQALHIAALSSLAVAQPLLDVLRRNPEFFVAHRSGLGDLLGLVALLLVIVPGCAIVVAWCAGLLSRRARDIVVGAILAVLAGALGLQVAKQIGVLPPVVAVVAAAAFGIAAAAAYKRWAPVRTFLTCLSPGIVLVPAVFLSAASMRSLVVPPPSSSAPPVHVDNPPPIVLVVFDQLPLTALMDRDRRINPVLYPGFAGLAKDATWFFNTTSVGEFTGWALPPIVTGKYSTRLRLPTSADHPNNLFTLLAASHRMQVVEPITKLCPESLCPDADTSFPIRMAAMGADLAVVYLHVILPPAMTSWLPSVTENWKDFAVGQDWHARWRERRDEDRRKGPLDFIEAIDAKDPQPTLYFLHVLLPHEPYMYLPSGQTFTTAPRLTGMLPTGRWGPDEIAVAENYRRQLLQVGFADRLMQRLIDRLKSAGIYDRALIVVSGDHGVSFRPNEAFKGLTATTAADIMAAPLLIKRPGGHEGVINTRRIENVDVLPTIADILGVRLGWQTDGISALNMQVPDRAVKTSATGSAIVHFDSDVIEKARDAAVDRKLSIIGPDGDPSQPLQIAPFRQLIGQRVPAFKAAEKSDPEVRIEEPSRFESVDLDADLLPVEARGTVISPGRPGRQVDLAVALNGTIVGTTRSVPRAPDSIAATWRVLFMPDVVRAGANDVSVFLVGASPSGPVLREAYRQVSRPRNLNLLSGEALYDWDVQQTGFYRREQVDGRSVYWWTNGNARLVVPRFRGGQPRSLRIGVVMTAPEGARLRVLVDGCGVFDGHVAPQTWWKTFDLSHCSLDGSKTTIDLLSTTFAPGGGGDRRVLGVRLAAVRIFDTGWPLPSTPIAVEDRRSQMSLIGVEEPLVLGGIDALLRVRVTNAGSAPWPAANDLPADQAGRGVRIGMRWAPARGPAVAVLEQAADLPASLYPGDEIETPVVLHPARPDGTPLPAGDYQLQIGLVQEGAGWFPDHGDRAQPLRVRLEGPAVSGQATAPKPRR